MILGEKKINMTDLFMPLNKLYETKMENEDTYSDKNIQLFYVPLPVYCHYGYIYGLLRHRTSVAASTNEKLLGQFKYKIGSM